MDNPRFMIGSHFYLMARKFVKKDGQLILLVKVAY